MVHTSIFDCIAVIKNLIGCNSLVDYKSFADDTNLVIQKVSVEAMIVFVMGGVAISNEGFEVVVLLVY